MKSVIASCLLFLFLSTSWALEAPENPCEWCRKLEPVIQEKLEKGSISMKISEICLSVPEELFQDCGNFLLGYGRPMIKRLLNGEESPCDSLLDLADPRIIFGTAPQLCSEEAITNYKNYVTETQKEIEAQLRHFDRVMGLLQKILEPPTPQQATLEQRNSNQVEEETPQVEKPSRLGGKNFFQNLSQKLQALIAKPEPSEEEEQKSSDQSTTSVSFMKDSDGNIWKETQSVYTSETREDGSQAFLGVVSLSFVSGPEGSENSVEAAEVQKSSLEGGSEERESWKRLFNANISPAVLHLTFVGAFLVLLIGFSVFLFKDMPLLSTSNEGREEEEMPKNLLPDYEEFEKIYYNSAKAEVDLSEPDQTPRPVCPFARKGVPSPHGTSEVDLSGN